MSEMTDKKLTPWWVAEGLGKYAMTDELLALRAENERLREALEKIANRPPWTNCDGQTRKDYPRGDEGLAEFWSDMAKGCEEIARAALSGEPARSGK